MVSFSEISGYITKYGKYVFLIVFIATVIRALMKIRKTGCIQVLAEEALWPSITAALFLIVMFSDDMLGWLNRKFTGEPAIEPEEPMEVEEEEEEVEEVKEAEESEE